MNATFVRILKIPGGLCDFKKNPRHLPRCQNVPLILLASLSLLVCTFTYFLFKYDTTNVFRLKMSESKDKMDHLSFILI